MPRRAEESNERAFSPSPTPVEDYDADSDQEWFVDGIVGESVDAFGVKRYEVKWGGNWRRPDGTNTTWDCARDNADLAPLVARWEARQAAKREARAAAAGGAVEVGVEDWHMLHEDATVERARAYAEIKAAYVREHPQLELEESGGRAWSKAIPVDFDGTRKTLGAPRPPSSREDSGTPSSSRRPSGSPAPPGPARSASPSSSSSRNANEVRGRGRGRGRPRGHTRQAHRVVASSDSDEERGKQGPSHRVRRTVLVSPEELRRRERVERRWARATKAAGAAAVTIVNDFNGEGAPPLVEGFTYLERSYVRAADVPVSEHVLDCLVSCDCDGQCRNADLCGCQEPSELVNDAGHRIFAYTRKGVFNFKLPFGMEVLECNDSCTCDDTCTNRVAQRPRKTPIEVFRTSRCGWGARADTAISRGTIVGIYTGRRAEAEKRQGTDHHHYIFDLDVREDENDDDEDAQKFSVDSHAHGNWTRFVNHSCQPNMRVFPVVWDTIPELNQPYLAFVASEDIPPRTELTIDYDPKAQNSIEGDDPPHGARKCMCDTARCRGWVRV